MIMGIDLKMKLISIKSKFSKKNDIDKVKNKVSIDSMILILIPYLLVAQKSKVKQ
jgi:hypothetical protein